MTYDILNQDLLLNFQNFLFTLCIACWSLHCLLLLNCCIAMQWKCGTAQYLWIYTSVVQIDADLEQKMKGERVGIETVAGCRS